MIPELSSLFRGDLASVGAVLVLKNDPRSFEPVSDLIQPGRLSAVLDRFSTQYPNPEPRAVASQWSKIYFSKLIVPSVAASLMLDWRLPLDLDETGIILDELGRPEIYCLAHAGLAATPQTAEERFSFVISDHIAPIIDAIARVSGLSRKVLWSNAGNIFENVVGYCEKSAPANSGIRQARAFLAARRLAGGEANPLFEPVRYAELDGARVRKRRVCCIRYLMPSLGYCKTCPLLKRETP
ncbi:MAG: siderophore-iron reductase FhuF [Allorhizobium sp.]